MPQDYLAKDAPVYCDPVCGRIGLATGGWHTPTLRPALAFWLS